jgi:ketosteroid isomerase-like protein
MRSESFQARRFLLLVVAMGHQSEVPRRSPKREQAERWPKGGFISMPKYAHVAFMLFSASLLLAQAQPTSDTQALTQLEATWNNAHLKGDTATLDSLWADDMEVVVPKMQPMTKAQSLAFAKSGRMHFQRYETSDIKVRVYGDAAVVTGRLQRTRTINDKEVDDDWRFVKVYVRQAKNWRVVLFQASDSAQP